MRYAHAVGQVHRILRAELLAVGSELTVGETRDTNSAELARALTIEGVEVGRVQALPDTLDVVRDAFAAALDRAELVVSTGGLGPTPDDLTREAVAAVCGEVPEVDPELEAWLRGLWARRDMAFPEINLKQAWRIPSATPLPNPNGTAPGWWVDRPDGRVVVTLPGPPREMRPMWQDAVLPRLRARGLGRETSVVTLRLAGIGESQVADLLGEDLLRAANPTIATYARADAVDVRIAAVAADGRTAAEIAGAAERRVLEVLGEHVWGRADTTWPAAIGERLAALDWTLASTETGTGGSFALLLGDVPWRRFAEIRTDASDAPDAPDAPAERALEGHAERVRSEAGADVGVAILARPRGDDTAVEIAVATRDRTHRERRLAFLGGASGRTRAALVAASVVLSQLPTAGVPASAPSAGVPSEVHR